MNCTHCAAALPADPVRIGDAAYCCSGCAAAAGLLSQLRAAGGDADAPTNSAAGAFADNDRAEVAARLLVPGQRGEVLHAAVDNLRCVSCVRTLEAQLRSLPGLLALRIDAATRRAQIEFDRSRLPLSRLLSVAASAGHTLHPDGVARDLAALKRERRSAQLRLGITLILSMQGMMFVEALYYGAAGDSDAIRDAFRWLALLCAAPVVLYGGAPFLRAGLAQLRARAPGMDLLVSLSVWLAFLTSGWMTWRGIAGPIYLDAALMFVGLLSIARHLEEAARRRATAQVLALSAREQSLVRCQRGDSQMQVHPHGLQIGDVVSVASGEEVPADGLVLGQPAMLSEALLSGESMPIHKPLGARVLAGSVVISAELQLKVSASGTDTVRAALGRRVAQASAQRPPLALWGERLASQFVWWMLGLAAISGCIWWLIDPAMALPVTLAVLAGGCPCALAMAVPTASAAAYGRLAGDGVLVLRGSALQALARIDHMVFDKTGTLTQASMRVQDQGLRGGLDAPRALRIAAALERGSPHPLARLFQRHDAGLTVEHAQQHALGVSGRIEGRDYRLGRADFVSESAAAVDGEVWLAQVDGPERAVFVWDEQLKPDALLLLGMIRQLGITPHLLSGDTPARAQRMAAQLQIDHCIAAATPDEKLAQLASLRAGVAQARCIAMIGDGHNDAPSLAGADVSMALADGADAARQAADIVLCSPRLTRIGEAVLLSRQLRRVCQQSLLWALLYNLGMLPLAVTGLLSPGWAALGMSLSSLLVTLNALRLRRPVQAVRRSQDRSAPKLVVSREIPR